VVSEALELDPCGASHIESCLWSLISYRRGGKKKT
jgi:hypothetical protein